MRFAHVVRLGFVAVAACAGACNRATPGTSPFAPEGRLDVPGVIAVVRVNEPVQTPGASLDLLVLDAARYGGRFAAVLSGEARERALAGLQAEKILDVVPGEDGAYRVNLPAFVTPGNLMQLGGKEARAADAIASSAAPSPLRRFDHGDCIALLPTVDLSEIAYSMKDAIRDADVAGQTFVAAINGREISRFLEHDVMPKLRSASAMMRMLGHSGSGDDMLNGIESSRRLLDGFERWTIRARTGSDRIDFESQIDAVADSATAGIFAALRPIDGEWPESKLRVAFDPGALAAALERQAAALPGDASSVDEVRDFLAGVAHVLRDCGIDRVTENGAHLGDGVDPAAAARTIREFGARLFRLEPAFLPDPPRFANGWLFFRDVQPMAPATAAGDDVLSITIPGDEGGRVSAQRSDRGIRIRGGGVAH